MGEDEVRIPIRIEVDEKDLTELKADIEHTFNDVQRYEKSFSTKKQPFKLVDVNATKAEIDRVLADIGRLQNEFTATANNTPMNRWRDVTRQIGEALKESSREYKEMATSQARLGSYSKVHKKDLAEIADLERKIAESEQRYIDAKSKIDTSKKGAKTELRNLEKQYNEEQKALKSSLSAATAKEAASRAVVNQSRAEVASLKASAAERDKTIASLRSQAQRIGTLAKDESYVKEEELRRRDALKEINAELKKQQEYVEGLQKQMEQQYYADQKRTGQTTGPMSKHDKAVAAQTEKQRREELEAAKMREQVLREEQKIRRAIAAEEVKAREQETAQKIAAINKEVAAVKQSASQYYYKLRAVKMLSFVFNNATNAINRFDKVAVTTAKRALSAYLKLIPGVSRLQKAISKATVSQKKFNKETKSTTLTHENFNKSLKTAITNLLKYGFGIRSLFVLFNKLRRAISDGFGQMSLMFDDVNQNMSSIITSINQIKAAITGMIEPLLSVIAPILEKISAIVSDIAYKVASFIAALTGQSAVYKATRNQIDYAKSLDKTAKSAKDAKKELSGLDKLNVINSEKDTGKEDAGAMGWEKVPIDATMADWANKFKKFLEDLFGPIKRAWDRVKAYLESSWKYMCGQLKALLADVARDFWRVWNEFKTEEMFRYIFLAIGDIMNIIGTLAKKFREAWNYAENGYRILAAIRDIGYEIAKHFHDITSYTRDWAERELNFKPAMTAIADVLQKQVVPAVKRVLDLVVVIWNYGILDLVRDFINTNLPVLIRGVGYFIEGFGLIAKRIQMALETGRKVDGQLEYTRSRLQQILDKVEHFSHLISETFKQMGKDFKDWADSLDFRPLFDSVIKFLDNLTPMFEFLFGKFEWLNGEFQHTGGVINQIWHDIILPFWKYMIEDGGPKLLDILGKIFGQYDEETGMGIKWDELTTKVKDFIPVIEDFLELSWETFLHVIEDIGKAFDDFVNSGTLGDIIDKFSDWVHNADPEELATKIERFVTVLLELTAALNLISKVLLPIITSSMTIVNFFKQAQMANAVKNLSRDVSILAGTGSESTGLAGLVTKLKDFVVTADLVNPKIVSIGTTIGGIVSIVAGSIMALTSFFDMMDNGFSVSSELVMLLGIALTAVGAILLGAPAVVAGVVAAIVAVVANFVIAIQTMPEEFAKKVNEVGEFIGKIPEKIEGFLNSLLDKVKDFGHNLGVKVGEFIANAPQKLEEWRQNLLVFIDNVDWMELGINILKGILYIFSLPARLGGFILEAIGNFVDSFIKGLQEGFDMHSPSKLMEPYGENILLGVLGGITNIIPTIISKLSTGVITKIVNVFKNGLKPDIFSNIAKWALAGLQRGLSNISGIMSTVSNICHSITSKFTSLFKIGSPSKLFEYYGNMLDAGLENGIRDDADSVGESFEELVPSAKILDTFYDKFLDMIARLTESTTLMFDDMFAHIEESMTSMEKLMQMSNLYQSLDNVPQMKLPDIVNGYTLPSNKEFKQNAQEFDVSKLTGVIKDAVIDAITSTIDLRDNDETVIVNIDGKEVFQAVRNKNSEYKKQHGVSAFT